MATQRVLFAEKTKPKRRNTMSAHSVSPRYNCTHWGKIPVKCRDANPAAIVMKMKSEYMYRFRFTICVLQSQTILLVSAVGVRTPSYSNPPNIIFISIQRKWLFMQCKYANIQYPAKNTIANKSKNGHSEIPESDPLKDWYQSRLQDCNNCVLKDIPDN